MDDVRLIQRLAVDEDLFVDQLNDDRPAIPMQRFT